MFNNPVNDKNIATVASALKKLKKEVVFVGGAVIGFYTKNKENNVPRVTFDIDVIIEVVSYSQLENLRIFLLENGFTQSIEDNVTCRFRLKSIIVDVMSTKNIGWTSANKWFKQGLKYKKQFTVNKTKINILSLPFYLATKCEAFKNRGKIAHPAFSKDFEDLVFLLENAENLLDEIGKAPKNLRQYLKNEFTIFLEDSILQDVILGNLPYNSSSEKLIEINDKLKMIINL